MYDITVVGAGIIGLATSYRLLDRYPDLRIVVVEKEPAPGMHQTGRNSGVLHTGVYYRPGSLKARLCTNGARRLRSFCEQHGIPYRQCGKVIVAVNDAERGRLQEIAHRGRANGVPGLREVNGDALRELEPHARGVAALHVPSAAAVDFARVADVLAHQIGLRGGEIRTGVAVRRVREEGSTVTLETTGEDIPARYVINCAGLHADRVAGRASAHPPLRIIPFRGEYFAVRGESRSLVKSMIYPVPDPRFPFLGVHFTTTAEGGVTAGPNAVFAFAREGYTRGTVRPGDLWNALTYPGLWALGRAYWRTGLLEFWRSLSKRAFVRALQRLVPDITADALTRGRSGVRAQAVARNGRLVDDFVIVGSARAIHVLNAPSPGATACLAIADHIGDLAHQRFALGAPRAPAQRVDAHP